MYEQETIVAIATPPGRGGIGVVRVSGPKALEIVTPLLRSRRALAAGLARFAEIVDTSTAEVLDEAVVTYFAAPRSYTGEDVVEIAGHGAPVLMEYLLRQCCAGGARLAEAGEFTQRAFLAGRIDLTQAEAVGDLIEASTLEQARVAARQMGGGLSREIAPVKERLVFLIAGIEAGMDFAEDDIDLLEQDQIRLQIDLLMEPLRRLERSFAYGRMVRDGFTLALVGRPNVGKSSLFNRLLERERAIVTAAPGTTRDPIAERVSIGGIPVELVDTAGLRVSGEAVDEAERIGIARAREAMAEAAVIVLVVDASGPLDAEDVAILQGNAERGLVIVMNKMDLVGADSSSIQGSLTALGAASVLIVRTSALTGDGIEQLRNAILNVLQGAALRDSSVMVTNMRQHQTIIAAMAGLQAAKAAVSTRIPHEMVLLDLYEGLRGLDLLTGATTTEDVLQLIFGRFCIGK